MLQVLAVATGTRVLTICRRNCEEKWVGDHLAGDTGAEFLDVTTNVTEEGITAPPPQEHDDVHRDALKIHGHRGTTADGMKANVSGGETEFCRTNKVDGGAEALEDVGGVKMNRARGRGRGVEIDRGVVRGTRDGANAADDFCKLDDGAHEGVVCTMGGHAFITAFIFLVFEGQCD